MSTDQLVPESCTDSRVEVYATHAMLRVFEASNTDQTSWVQQRMQPQRNAERLKETHSMLVRVSHAATIDTSYECSLPELPETNQEEFKGGAFSLSLGAWGYDSLLAWGATSCMLPEEEIHNGGRFSRPLLIHVSCCGWVSISGNAPKQPRGVQKVSLSTFSVRGLGSETKESPKELHYLQCCLKAFHSCSCLLKIGTPKNSMRNACFRPGGSRLTTKRECSSKGGKMLLLKDTCAEFPDSVEGDVVGLDALTNTTVLASRIETVVLES
eukprot:2094070-Amphidinium_carterae.2